MAAGKTRFSFIWKLLAMRFASKTSVKDTEFHAWHLLAISANFGFGPDEAAHFKSQRAT